MKNFSRSSFKATAARCVVAALTSFWISGLKADEIISVDDLKDTHRPALNYPQSVAWKAKRNIDSLYALRASDVLGRKVYNAVGNEVGEVDDIVIPGEGAPSPLRVVVEVGGFLGLGEKLVAIPYSELRVEPDNDDHIFYNATEKQLLSLPVFQYTKGEVTGKSIYKKRGYATRSELEWAERMPEMKRRWSKLTATDWSSVEQNPKLLASKIQVLYGLTKEAAQAQIASIFSGSDNNRCQCAE